MQEVDELLAKWQKPPLWEAAFLCAQTRMDRTAPADPHFESQQRVAQWQAELDQIVDHVRATAPQLLHLVPVVSFFFSPHGEPVALAEQIRQLESELAAVLESQHPECFVTMLQMAAMVNRGKRAIERLTATKAFPNPAVKGGGGKPNEWRWADVRPILENKYGRVLPEVFPADRFVR
jgi:hypothetical protein